MDYLIESNKMEATNDILTDFQMDSLRNRIMAVGVTPFGDLKSNNEEEINKTISWYIKFLLCSLSLMTFF